MKSALLEGKEDSEDGLRAGCLPSFPFSPLSPLSSAKTLSPHPTNSFSIRMSAEIPDRKRLPSNFPTRLKSIFLRDFGLTLLFLRGLMFRKRVPTCTVCIDCLPQCPLTGHFTEFLSTSKSDFEPQRQRNEHFRGLSFAIGQVKAGSVASLPSYIYDI